MTKIAIAALLLSTSATAAPLGADELLALDVSHALAKLGASDTSAPPHVVARVKKHLGKRALRAVQPSPERMKALMGDFPGAPLMALAAHKLGTDAVRAVQAAARPEFKDDFYTLAGQGEFDAGTADYVTSILAKAVQQLQPRRLATRQ